MKDHSSLSAIFGATVAGTILEKTVDVMSVAVSNEPIIIGAALALGSLVGGFAGYASSYHFNAFMKGPVAESKDTYKHNL